MPKDPSKNINQYKIAGGELNEFEYQENQHDFVEQQKADKEHLIPGTPPEQQVEAVIQKAHATVTRRAAAKQGKQAKESTKKTASKTSTKKSAAKKSSKKTGSKTFRKGTASKKSASQKARTTPSKKASSKKTSTKTSSGKSTRKAASKK